MSCKERHGRKNSLLSYSYLKTEPGTVEPPACSQNHWAIMLICAVATLPCASRDFELQESKLSKTNV